MPIYDSLTKNHVESFDFALDYSLPKGIKYLKQLELQYDESTRLEVSIYKAEVGKPTVHKDARCRTRSTYPSECRMAGFTYKAPLKLSFQVKLNGKLVDSFEEHAGDLPIMLKSKRCNLYGLDSQQLIEHKEEPQEAGGYFIINGNEKLIRFLIAQLRNYPIVMTRKSWKKAAKMTSDLGIHCRCVKKDQISNDMIIHYLTNGSVKIRILIDKMTVYLPLILLLRALCDYSNQKICQMLMQGCEHDTFYYSCVTNMIKQIENENLNSQEEILNYIGERTRGRYYYLEKWHSDQEIAHYLLQNSIAVHLDQYEDKFNFLVFCTKKLFAARRGDCALENVDSPQLHEIYTSGQIYVNYLLERMSIFLQNMKIYFSKLSAAATEPLTVEKVRKSIQQQCSEVGKEMIRFLSVGNIRAQSTAGLRQDTSFSVIAEKINYYRFISHFRAVHRGSFFMEMRTTECRKLYPESWGFLCPVHTPDGAPCGLLNHLSLDCSIVSSKAELKNLEGLLDKLGLVKLEETSIPDYTCYTHVLLDGKVIGFVADEQVQEFVRKLRKAKRKEEVPAILEIGYVPKSTKATQYSAIYLMTTPCRMMRPVINLDTKKEELIGIFEQVYLEIAVKEEERHELTTHQELRSTAMLSLLASLIPYSDFNQSPRNMYCCQMKKQTMGTGCHSLKYRSENKMYTITTPQTPFCRNEFYDKYAFDEYPLGTNAVVAVISYTGYDMEDALILNKSSVERGFKDGSVSRSVRYDLKELSKENKSRFGRQDKDENLCKFLDVDGLPYLGIKLKYNDPICSYIDLTTLDTKVERYRYTEEVFVSDVKLIGNELGSEPLTTVVITLHIPRRPAIGDKFANRHGQKGVVSYLYSNENMPFTSLGITPDVIFNPHGFPSRMTIGQMLESMAGKVACLDGKFKDATPFKFSEENAANEYYGQLLKEADFNYYGTETMYSGIDGRPLNANIFVGVVYYIRLRHMVGDKYQVRSTGPIDQLTHQPVQGRKRCGGIRFGEMERDSLLAHGASFLLQDRLYNQSDKSQTHICTKCKSILSSSLQIQDTRYKRRHSNAYACKLCESSEFIKPINLPYVVRYLASELASVNIKLQFSVSE